VRPGPGRADAALLRDRRRRSAEASASLDDVVRSRVLLTDPAVIDAVSAVHAQAYAVARPAATMVVFAGLVDPRWKLEIEAEAVLTSTQR